MKTDPNSDPFQNEWGRKKWLRLAPADLRPLDPRHPGFVGRRNRILAECGRDPMDENDSDPLHYLMITETCGLYAGIFAMAHYPPHHHLWRLFSLKWAWKMEVFMDDLRLLGSLEVAGDYCFGKATDAELESARIGAVAASADISHPVKRAAALAAASVCAPRTLYQRTMDGRDRTFQPEATLAITCLAHSEPVDERVRRQAYWFRLVLEGREDLVESYKRRPRSPS